MWNQVGADISLLYSSLRVEIVDGSSFCFFPPGFFKYKYFLNGNVLIKGIGKVLGL